MNKERILQLAEHLETFVTDEQFDMGTWGHIGSCGTVGCIAGWATALFRPEAMPHKKELDRLFGRNELGLYDQVACRPSTVGREALDLTTEQEFYLFTPPNISYGRVTRQQAAKVLRHFAATGEIDWRPIRKCQKEQGFT